MRCSFNKLFLYPSIKGGVKVRNNLKKSNKMSVEAYACSCIKCSCGCSCSCYHESIRFDNKYAGFSGNKSYSDTNYYSFQTIHQNGGM